MHSQIQEFILYRKKKDFKRRCLMYKHKKIGELNKYIFKAPRVEGHKGHDDVKHQGHMPPLNTPQMNKSSCFRYDFFPPYIPSIYLLIIKNPVHASVGLC